jgi:hypothetical protein
MKLHVHLLDLALFGTFVERMDSKRTKDYNFIEKTYQEMLTEQRLKSKSMESQNFKNKNEIGNLQRMIHNMKSKLANDYLLISQLRKERDYAQDCLSIVEQENAKIVEEMSSLCEDIKTIDADFEKYKDYGKKFRENLEQSKNSRLAAMNTFKLTTEHELNKRQKYELNKIVEEDDGKYKDFATHDKSCTTTDLISVKTVNITFLPVKIKKEVAHKCFQKVLQKPKTSSVYIQADLLRNRDIIAENENINSRSSDNDSAKDSMYRRKMMDRIKIEHMVIPPSGTGGSRKSFVRQTTLVPGTISEMLEDNSQDEDELEYQLGNSDSFMFLGPGRVDDNLGEKSNFNKSRGSSRMSSSNQRNSNKGMKDLRKYNTTKEGHTKKKEPLVRKSVLVVEQPSILGNNRTGSYADVKSGRNLLHPTRKLISQKTVGYLRDGPSNDSMNDSVDEKPFVAKSTFDLDHPMNFNNFGNFRENKLRNELIRQKQLYKTIHNRLMVTGEDTTKAAELQASLDSTLANIEGIDKLLKNFRKSTFADGSMSRTSSHKAIVAIGNASSHSSYRIAESKF